MTSWLSRVAAHLSRKRAESDLADELNGHLPPASDWRWMPPPRWPYRFDFRPREATVMIVVSLVLVAFMLAAAIVPALRAATLDPVTALRDE